MHGRVMAIWIAICSSTFLAVAPRPALGDCVFTDVSAGGRTGCGVRPDGAITCWGESSGGQTTPAPGTYMQVSAGETYNCGLRSDGSVGCWGYESEAGPPPAGFFKQISTSQTGTVCGLRLDDTVACWARAGGSADFFGVTTPPAGTFSQVSAGRLSACGVRTDGTLACWGASFTPIPPSGTFVQVQYPCGIRSDGTVACWNSAALATAPSGTFTKISVDELYEEACGVRSDGTIACWGNTSNVDAGQLIPPSGTFTHVSLYKSHACGLRVDGTVACWGDDSLGQSTPQCDLSSVDRDGDGILDDGDGSGIFGDAPCPNGVTVGCDDDCPLQVNPLQEESDGDGIGDACDSNCHGASGGTISGTIFAVSAASVLPGAPISVCGAGCCETGESDALGQYSFSGLHPGGFVVTAYPPTATVLFSAKTGTLTIAGMETLSNQDLILDQPQAPPPGTTVTTHASTSAGNPVVYRHEPIGLSVQAAGGGSATYEIIVDGSPVGSGTLVEGPAGTYSVTIPGLNFPRRARVVVTIDHPTDPTAFGLDVYIDPSGFVRFVNGDPAVGAAVRLLRSESPDGPFALVADGSAIMSPSNRTNPDTAAADGAYGWDVIPGYYVVQAQLGPKFAASPVLTIPPAVTDLVLDIGCPPVGDGATCDDGDACTVADACMAGVCRGQQICGVPISGAKLIVVDKVASAGRAKVVFVAKDAVITKGPGTDSAQIDAKMHVAFDAVDGRFDMPQGANWVANSATVARYVNSAAPTAGSVKVGVIKTGLVKTVAKSLGDLPLDVSQAPTGPVYVASTVVNGSQTLLHCVQFATCMHKTIAAGTGYRLVCKDGTGDATCHALVP
jgi:Regulator of Chromosome Condensation (RCC1) repeat protein